MLWLFNESSWQVLITIWSMAGLWNCKPQAIELKGTKSGPVKLMAHLNSLLMHTSDSLLAYNVILVNVN